MKTGDGMELERTARERRFPRSRVGDLSYFNIIDCRERDEEPIHEGAPEQLWVN